MTVSMNLQKGLIGHWTCDDNTVSNGELKDRSSYSNPMQMQNSPSTGHDSPNGESVQFDATNESYTTSSFIDPYNISGNFSMAIWIYLDSDPNVDSNNNYRMVFSPGGSYNPYGILVEDQIAFRCNAFIGGNRKIIDIGSISVGEWVHLGYTCDPSNGEMVAYKNGSLYDTNSFTTGSLDSNNSGIQLTDSGGSSSGGTFPGKLSDARLYNRKLSEQEFQQLYNMRNQRNYYV